MFVSDSKMLVGSKPSERLFDFMSPDISVFHSTILFPFLVDVDFSGTFYKRSIWRRDTPEITKNFTS